MAEVEAVLVMSALWYMDMSTMVRYWKTRITSLGSQLSVFILFLSTCLYSGLAKMSVCKLRLFYSQLLS